MRSSSAARFSWFSYRAATFLQTLDDGKRDRQGSAVDRNCPALLPPHCLVFLPVFGLPVELASSGVLALVVLPLTPALGANVRTLVGL